MERSATIPRARTTPTIVCALTFARASPRLNTGRESGPCTPSEDRPNLGSVVLTENSLGLLCAAIPGRDGLALPPSADDTEAELLRRTYNIPCVPPTHTGRSLDWETTPRRPSCFGEHRTFCVCHTHTHPWRHPDPTYLHWLRRFTRCQQQLRR